MMNRNSRSKEEVGGIIKSILVAEKKSSTIGMPIVQLEEEYRSQDGMRIPYRALGYGCLLEFLESLQRKGDIVVGKRGSMHVVYPCVDEKIAHVSALVSGQKDSIKRCSRGGRRNTSRSYPRVPYQPPRLTSNTLTDVLKVIKRAHNGMHVSKIIEYLHDRNIFTVEENHLIRQLRDVSHEVSIENSMIYPIVKQENNLQNFPPTNVNNTNGYAAEKNPAPAYKPAGFSDAEDDDMTFEFVKKSESVQSVPPENSNQLENEKSKAATLNIDENENAAGREEENCPANDNDDIGMLVNSRTRFRLEKLIQKHPNGIWCAELPKFYHQEYCIPLNYEDLGFGNVSDFAAHLPEIFHCVRLQDKGDFKLFDAKSPKPETRTSPRPGHLTLAALHNIYESYHDEVEPVPVLLSPTTSQRLVPEGVMTVGETVGQICVTQLFCDNTPHIDVIVVDAVTPTFFWIQLLRKTQKFGQFMRVLHEFYSENASKYVIPIVLLERGLNCACIYDKKWHRGVIKTVHPNSSVTVMFYDYGTVLTYPPQDIHFLHRSFSSLPAQAIPCGLYNLKPKSTEKWPYRVCQVFSEQVLDVPMVAMLGSIDADNNSMLIALTNTEGTVDFHISDWMISSGFAVYGRMGETVDMNEKHDERNIGEVNFAAESCNPLGSSSATGGPPEMPTMFPTIRSAEESINIPDSSNQNVSTNRTAQTPQIFEAYVTEFAKMRDAMQAEFEAFMNQLTLTVKAYPLKCQQLDVVQTPNQSADCKVLDNLLNNLNIDARNEQLHVSLEPPPLPPRPNQNYAQLTANHELQNQAKIQNFQENNIYRPTNFQKHDFNMNCAKNPFDYTANNASMAPVYNLEYQSFSNNNNQSNSTMWDNMYSVGIAAAQQVPKVFSTTTSAPQEPPQVFPTAPATFYYQKENPQIIPQEMQPKDPISLITPRETFEMSLEESAKSFFERLDAKFKPKIQETNPFKVSIDSGKFEEKISLPVAPSLSPRSSIINPFAPERDAYQRDKISPTKVPHDKETRMFDFSSKNGTQNKLPATTSVEIEQEAFAEAKRMNIESWLTMGINPKPNYVNKYESQVSTGKSFAPSFTGDFPSRIYPNIPSDLRMNSNVSPSFLPEQESSSCRNETYSDVFKADVHNTPVADYVGTEWLQAANDGIKFPSKESTAENVERHEESQVIATAALIAGKIDREESVELPVQREAEVSHTIKTWVFKEIHLTKQTVHLINLDNEGWLTVEEFLTAFTTYKMPDVVLRILDIQKAHIPFRYIQRLDYPALFDQLEKTSLAVPRNHNKKIGDVLHLAPLKSILKMLRKLKIVDLKEVELATKKRKFPSRTSALFDACTIITIYANLQYDNSPS